MLQPLCCTSYPVAQNSHSACCYPQETSLQAGQSYLSVGDMVGEMKQTKHSDREGVAAWPRRPSRGGALHGDTSRMRGGAFWAEAQPGKGQKHLSLLFLGNKQVRGEWHGMKLEKYIGRDRFLYPLALVSCDEDLGFHSVESHWSVFLLFLFS